MTQSCRDIVHYRRSGNRVLSLTVFTNVAKRIIDDPPLALVRVGHLNDCFLVRVAQSRKWDYDLRIQFKMVTRYLTPFAFNTQLGKDHQTILGTFQ